MFLINIRDVNIHHLTLVIWDNTTIGDRIQGAEIFQWISEMQVKHLKYDNEFEYGTF